MGWIGRMSRVLNKISLFDKILILFVGSVIVQ